MGLISLSGLQPADGETIDATDVNNQTNAIVDEFNGGIDNTNIDASADIAITKLNAGVRSKIITGTRDFAAASGDVAYTGVGFTPTSIMAFAYGGTYMSSVGVSDSAGAEACSSKNYDSTSDGGAFLIYFTTAAGAYQTAVVKTYDADGFTLTWTKVSTASGVMQLKFICYR